MTQARFVALIRRVVTPGADVDAQSVYAQIEGRYSEPGRHYHTCKHLAHCLRQFDLVSERLDDSDAVELALWFHDVIYDPLASDNEQRSADLFENLLGKQLAGARVRKVYDFILMTMHRELPQGDDERYLVDIDLSSFALPWREFTRDSEAVRAEFPHLSDKEFYVGHVGFLRGLLDRESFYATRYFSERFEHRARENIARHLLALEQRGLA